MCEKITFKYTFLSPNRKSEEAETKAADVGQPTHIPNGDYKLTTAKYLNA